jgi:hypothetical protein
MKPPTSSVGFLFYYIFINDIGIDQYLRIMISEKHIEKINNVIKDMVFDYNGESLDGVYVNFKYQFKIIGQRQLISVGELYDHLQILVKIIDGDEKSTVIFAVFKSLNVNITKEYRLRNSLDRNVSEELSYFFGVDGVRVIISDIEFSEEYEEKINDTMGTFKK